MTVPRWLDRIWLCLVAVSFAASAAGQSPSVLVRVTPTQHAPFDPAVYPTALRDTCLNPMSWPTGWARMELFSNGLGFFGQLATNERIECFNNLRADRKMLAFGVGALKEWCTTAQACWNAQSGEILQYYNEGAPLEYLILDEPLTTSFDHAYTNTVQETAEFVRLARQTYPNIKIILQEAYPHQPATTLMTFFRDVNEQTISLTGWGIQYAELDHDWNDPAGDPMDLIRIQDYVRDHGMYFSSIYWNADPNRAWYDGVMRQGQMYLDWSRYGLSPDMRAIDNWTSSPSATLPETNNGTFTRSVRDFVNAYTPTPTGTFGLLPNEVLQVGDSRPSIDGRFALIYQEDGNLVLYQGDAALWASNTSGTLPNVVAMQGDGNLVIYDANGTPVWASNTSGHPGAYLVVQSDGNAVVYDGVHAQWATNTNTYTPVPTEPFSLRPNEVLYVGDSRPSVDGRFLLIYQGDGNLVLYYGGAALWASNTDGTSPNIVVMQGDGNLVIYDADGTPVWASNTSGHPGAYLVVQTDGNAVVYDGIHAQWATNTNYY